MPSARTTALAALLALALAPAPAARAQTRVSRVRLVFTAQSPAFADATREYERFWADDGTRIVAAMERISGLTFVYTQFADTLIPVTVLEAVSNSGYRNESPILLRASYTLATKRATVVHELGHRLMEGLIRRDESEHAILYLWLYDTWIALWGQQFADEQVAVERGRGGPYPAAWDSALALTAAERATKWKAFLAERMPSRR